MKNVRRKNHVDLLRFESVGENLKATFKNQPDESIDVGRERTTRDPNAVTMFQNSQTHLNFLRQQFQTIKTSFKSINERKAKNGEDFGQIEQNLQ